MVGFFDRLRKTLAGSGTAEPESYWVYAQCNRCGEALKARVDLRNELSLAEDGETYIVRKGLLGSGAQRCFQVVDVTLHFDAQKQQVLASEVSGGRLLTAEEYSQLLAEAATQREERFMRTPIIAGNWKMNKTPAEAIELVRALVPLVAPYPEVETVVCPPFVALPAVAEALRGSRVGVGAQNVFWADQGAYTGEVSPPMLVGLAQYVIIGHSERRQYFGETNESVNRKLRACLPYGLTPIVAVGENLEQNEAGATDQVVAEQVRAAFVDVTAEQLRQIVIAYEPVWAIGTGRTATPEVANRVCGLIRSLVADLYDQETAQAVRIQYGGSTNEKNIGDIMRMPEIDGALVGGASLKADSFAEMVRITAEARS